MVRASACNAEVVGSTLDQADFLLTRFLIELGSRLPNKGVVPLTNPGLVPISPVDSGMWSRYHPTYPGRPRRFEKQVERIMLEILRA